MPPLRMHTALSIELTIVARGTSRRPLPGERHPCSRKCPCQLSKASNLKRSHVQTATLESRALNGGGGEEADQNATRINIVRQPTSLVRNKTLGLGPASLFPTALVTVTSARLTVLSTHERSRITKCLKGTIYRAPPERREEASIGPPHPGERHPLRRKCPCQFLIMRTAHSSRGATQQTAARPQGSQLKSRPMLDEQTPNHPTLSENTPCNVRESTHTRKPLCVPL